MIITNDPQFPWPSWYDSNEKPEFCYEQWHKVNAISKKYRGELFTKWPDKSQLGGNPAFDIDKADSPVPPLEGVIINGDLIQSGFDDSYVYNMVGEQVSDGKFDWSKRIRKDRNWFYRDYYVTWLNKSTYPIRNKILPVYAGFGNHDPKWTLYDLACALTLPEEYNDPKPFWVKERPSDYSLDKQRKWINFPSEIKVHYNDNTKSGSLAYSWDIGNYHFVQANLLYDHIGETLNLGTKWLDGMKIESPIDWLTEDLTEATRAEQKIIFNLHGRWQENGTVVDMINGTNVVAVFRGHYEHQTGFIHYLKNGHTNEYAWNKFGHHIPVFQGGHSGNDGKTFVYDNELLIVECADDYMNVGLVHLSNWNDKNLNPVWKDPTNSKNMRTIKWGPALSGFVNDEYHNKPLADVTITCDDKTTTTNARTTTTNASGYYEITSLDPGDYARDYWVEMTIPPGYNSIVPIKPATITANQETIVDFAAYPVPDMKVTKATVDTARLAGDTITYHITVDNQGDGPANNIVITDVLPSMTTFISADHPATTNGQTLTWSIGTLNEHTSTTIELTVRISLLVYPDTTLNNLVTVAFDDWHGLPQTPKDASATTKILPTVPTENVQGVGYWRRQIKAVQANKPCDYTASELLLLLEKIRVSSQVFETVSTLENAADLLVTPTGKDTMETRATQQLFALWLNLAARAVAADTPLNLADVTPASTIAEALTQCEAILLDPAHTKASCECSKEICDLLNNGEGLSW